MEAWYDIKDCLHHCHSPYKEQTKVKSVSVKKLVLVKISKFINIGISMAFKLKKTIDIVMLFTLQNQYRYK